MSYIGKNPSVKTVTFEGYTDFATADASVKREGRLVYARLEKKFFKDDGTALQDLSPSETVEVVIDTKVNIDALGRQQGLLYYATDENVLYTDSGAALIKQLDQNSVIGDLFDVDLPILPTNGQVLAYNTVTSKFEAVDIVANSATFQSKLTVPLQTDGVVSDLAVTGLVVGKKYKVTANAKCVRSGVSQNEIQELTFSAVPNEGSFILDFGGQTTTALYYDSVPLDIQTALEALSNVDAAGIAVVGDFLSGFTIEFIGTEGLTPQPILTIPTNVLKSGGTGGLNEIQRFTFSEVGTSGSFTLTFDGEVTAAIAYNANAAAVKSAIEALVNVDEVAVTGDIATSFVVEFSGKAVERSGQNQTTSSSSIVRSVTLTILNVVFSDQSYTELNDLSNLTTITPGKFGSPQGYGYYITSGFYRPGTFTFFAVYPKAVYRLVSPAPAGTTITIKSSTSDLSASQNIAFSVVPEDFPTAISYPSASIANAVPDTNPSTITAVITVPTGTVYIYLEGKADSQSYFRSISITSLNNGTVTILDATDQEGDAITGGTLGTSSVLQTQVGSDGNLAVAIPSGIIVKESGVEIVRSEYQPPAQLGEPSTANIAASEVFTATVTGLTVEAFGLSGGQALGANETKVIVEER